MSAHGNSDNQATLQENRCLCGQLLAKLRPEGVEVKCKRCKRLLLIPYNSTGEIQINR